MPPPAPIEFSEITPTENSVYLQWEVNEREDRPVLHYIIEYQTSNDTEPMVRDIWTTFQFHRLWYN